MKDKIFEVIASELDVEVSEIKLESNLKDDLGADSLDAVELIMTIEEEFDVSIPEEDAMKVQTVGDIVTFLEKNKK